MKRLAIQVEDHDLAFGDFEGVLPEGEYGAGVVRIGDSGTYDWEEWTDQQIVFTVHGAQASGRFKLIRFKRGKPNKWLIIKVVVWATLVVRSAADKNSIPGPGASPNCWRKSWTTNWVWGEMRAWKANDVFKGAGWMSWISTKSGSGSKLAETGAASA